MARSRPAVGIDLGTTHSAVAFVDASGRPETIRNAEGGLTTPSVVFFDRAGPVVGAEAFEAGRDEPERMVQLGRHGIGERLIQPSILGQPIPSEVAQALVLRKLKGDAELTLGELDAAVIAVPASFNELQRKATHAAGRLAGLDVVKIINEPTAAALCFGMQQGFLSAGGSSHQPERVLVYDLGGGVFDASMIEIEGSEYRTLATAGDTQLGGIDWDVRVADYIAETWIDEHGTDPREDPMAKQILLRKAAQAKHALSQRSSVEIPFSHRGRRIRPELTRAQLQTMTQDLVSRTLAIVQEVLDEALFEWTDLTRLLLVGGSTRMPMIAEALSHVSGMKCDHSLSPDEAVAHGAAIYAGIRLGQDSDSVVSIKDVNSHDLGVLAKDTKTGQSRRQVMIPKHTQLPASRSVRFRTHEAGQQNMKVEIIEGGDEQGENATYIGKGIVDDLPNDLATGSFVDIRFDYSRGGRLYVSARVPSVNHNAKMTLTRAAGMSDDAFEQWKRRIDSGMLIQKLDTNADSPDPEPKHSPGRVATAPSVANAPSADRGSVKRKLRRASRITASERIAPDTSQPQAIKKLVRKPESPRIKSTHGDWTSRREKLG